MPAENSFWLDYLGSEPEAAYYSSTPFGGQVTAASPFGGGFAPAAQQYWSGQYGNVMRQFMGEAGRRMKTAGPGEDPLIGMNFVDFLEQYPWTQRYTALSPRQRPGGSTARFNPAARYMY
jgi:hypothetical protein